VSNINNIARLIAGLTRAIIYSSTCTTYEYLKNPFRQLTYNVEQVKSK